jgi:hypothetical protein
MRPGFGVAGSGCSMETRFDLVTIASATCVAVYAAIALVYLAIHHLGLSRDLVFSAAIMAATLIATMLAVDYFGKKLGNTK